MDEISSSKKNLIYIYIFHLFIELIIIILNIYYYISKYWIYFSFKIIFLIGIIIISFFLLYPIILLYLIYFKSYTNKIFSYKNKIITIIFLIINLLINVILNIIFWVNLSKFSNFYKECPYNYSFSKLNEISYNYNSNEICQKRICFNYDSKINNNIITFNNNDNIILLNNEYDYNYICTFDSSLDYNNNEITCQQIFFNTNNNYLNYCSKYIFYYLCQRINLPNKFNINNKDCPLENKNSKILNIENIFIIINILFSIIPWLLEIIYFKKFHNETEILNQDGNNNQNEVNAVQGEAQLQNVLNKTANTSEDNIRRQNLQINVNINLDENPNINETINENIKNESKDQVKYIFVGNENKTKKKL